METYIAAFAAALVLLKLISMAWRGGGIRRVKPTLSLPGYRQFYSDKKHEGGLLVSERYGLQGKPDMVYSNSAGTRMIPVELKSGTVGDAAEPREGDLMQLAAYFVIIEDVYGVRPRRGLLIYKDWMFKVKNDRRLRRRLERVISDMRLMLETERGEAEPSFVKCKHCVCRGTVCEYQEK
jgi:CRISPR-associated exonuclease Cas4